MTLEVPIPKACISLAVVWIGKGEKKDQFLLEEIKKIFAT